jgi:type I restriction enzyme S subunit
LNLYSTLSSIGGLVTGTSSSHQRIRPQDLLALPLLLPNFQVVDGYERTVASIFERINRNNEENQTLMKLRDILLPKLMTGKINVE